LQRPKGGEGGKRKKLKTEEPRELAILQSRFSFKRASRPIEKKNSISLSLARKGKKMKSKSRKGGPLKIQKTAPLFLTFLSGGGRNRPGLNPNLWRAKRFGRKLELNPSVRRNSTLKGDCKDKECAKTER